MDDWEERMRDSLSKTTWPGSTTEYTEPGSHHGSFSCAYIVCEYTTVAVVREDTAVVDDDTTFGSRLHR